MNLISQFIFAMIATMATGTMAYLIWKLIKPLCMRWHPSLLYVLLRVVCALYVLPVSYLGMQIGMRDGYLQAEGVWQLHFAPVGDLWNLIAVLVTGWTFFAGRQIRVCLFHWVDKHRLMQQSVPIEEETTLAEFAHVKRKLRIYRNVKLCRNEHISSPETRGIFFPTVMLPEHEYSKKQLSLVLHHELTHCKRWHLLYKLCGKCIGIVYPLGFLGEDLIDTLNEWTEFDCDTRAIAAMRNGVSASRYFEIIIDLMKSSLDWQDANHIFSGLYESQWKLGRRIDYMKKYASTKKVAGAVSAMMAALFIVINVTTIYAAGNSMTEQHMDVYKGVDEQTMQQESGTTPVLEEQYLAAEDDTSYERLEVADSTEMVMPLLDEEEMVSIDWTVSAGTRKMTTTFEVEAGQVIAVSTNALPASSVYWIGIMDEANNLRYVQGTGIVGHEFEIEDTGRYRVIVQNRGRVALTVVGSYCFYTPEEDSTEE